MELHTSSPFWLMKSGYVRAYPALTSSIRVDAAVIGAGITGALAAYALALEGRSVAVLDRRHPGMGSTAASTALLQYEIDEPLCSLREKVGRQRADQAYTACHRAVASLAEIVRAETLDADYALLPSLQAASYKKDLFLLDRECAARRELGMDVSLLDRDEVEGRFGFSAPGALLAEQAAQVDPYRLAHGLLRCRENIRVYDTTEVTHILPERSRVRLVCASGHKVEARHAVVACGYESVRFLPRRVLRLASTYALASKPMDPERLWERRALLWETKNPYLYVRTTQDNRVIVGGRDDPFQDHARRHRALPEKTRALLRDAARYMPGIALEADFSWAGAFGTTRDSLAYVGSLPALPRTWFILGFGGNGIVFSQTGAEIVSRAIRGRGHPFAATYAFDR